MAGRILIKNGTVVTMNDAGDVHFGGSVVLDGDRIADVGPDDEVAARHAAGQLADARVIDAAGKAVERSPAAVGVPGHVLVPDHPGAG